MTRRNLSPPKTGSFIGWKKCIDISDSHNYRYQPHIIVKLEVPADALRIRGYQNNGPDDGYRRPNRQGKVRVSKAKILAMYYLNDKQPAAIAYSSRRQIKSGDHRWHRLEYIVGAEVSVDNFEKSPRTCAAGIHLFMHQKDAENYDWT